jgi:hypothetical protein
LAAIMKGFLQTKICSRLLSQKSFHNCSQPTRKYSLMNGKRSL